METRSGTEGVRERMYYMNHDAVDYFQVDFTPAESVVGGKYYPLGTFAAEARSAGGMFSRTSAGAWNVFRKSSKFFWRPEIRPVRL